MQGAINSAEIGGSLDASYTIDTVKIFKPHLSYIKSLLMAERRIIYPDIRGRGNSARDPDWRNYHPAVYVGNVRHLLAALNLHKDS